MPTSIRASSCLRGQSISPASMPRSNISGSRALSNQVCAPRTRFTHSLSSPETNSQSQEPCKGEKKRRRLNALHVSDHRHVDEVGASLESQSITGYSRSFWNPNFKAVATDAMLLAQQ